MFAAPNGTEHALVSPAILDFGVGLVGREFLVARKNKVPKGTPRTSDNKGRVKETRKRKKNGTLDRERTRDSIDGRHLGCQCWGSFWLYWTVERKRKYRRLMLEPRTKFLGEKKKEKSGIYRGSNSDPLARKTNNIMIRDI